MTMMMSLLLAVLALLPGMANAQMARGLQSADAAAIDGGRVLVTLTLSSAAPEPIVFPNESPARVSIDLPQTRLAMAERYRKVNLAKVQALSAAENKDRTRLVIELTQMVGYKVRVDGNRIFVTIDALPSANAPLSSGVPPQNYSTLSGPVAAISAVPAVASITHVDFRRGEKGEGRIIVSLDNPQAVANVSDEGGRVVARFRNVNLADAQVRRLDVLDFATPVKFVDVLKTGSDAQVVIVPVTGGDFEQKTTQLGNQTIIELQPLSQTQRDERKKTDPQYTGEKVSLSFQSIDIRSLLQIIADVAGTNMVVSDSVTGEIAMRLQNVPWDQALDIILRTKGLGMRQQGNVMIVAPLAELAERDKIEAEAEKQKVELAPLRSELIQVNYAKVADVAALLKSGENSILSERGRVSIDDRTNTLLVLETREKINEIRTLIARLDIPVRQVLIESRIVIANNDYSKELGARFGVSAVRRNGRNGIISTSGSAEANDTSVNDYLSNGGFPVSPGALNDRFNVNLPAASDSAGKIALALLGKNYLVDLELSALQAEGRGEIISTPRVITSNAKQASIEQGVEIPYQEAASSGATSVSFKKAVLSLNVTPQITPDDRIIMDLAVNNDSVGQTYTTGSGGQVPSIDTRKVTTQVLVENGQTVVLGGIYQQENRNSVSKIPLLGDIPILGAAFRNRTTVNNRDELLVFVTPRILREGLQIN
ncbi:MULTISPECIES: type IV pilus secretin PilQ family protein [Hydrocarboniphaga]|uniref:type IV pilus secretin PilQ family protein n=1 Tax=Hydrocarboniphaga TaxID=243627 RepID=UPI002ABC6B11|nr:type IV pilus secretin PilQ family protein [Hydrocarboniphaga sp.]MDZ4077513.1 type IV pilus secretin PilQ family protein [Hydrocarboniphaga sp.]